jgi:hypothetical protein
MRMIFAADAPVASPSPPSSRSRIYPTSVKSLVPKSGKPDFGCKRGRGTRGRAALLESGKDEQCGTAGLDKVKAAPQ